MAQKMSQLREGSLRGRLGRPIMRRAGLPSGTPGFVVGGLGAAAGGASAMVWDRVVVIVDGGG